MGVETSCVETSYTEAYVRYTLHYVIYLCLVTADARVPGRLVEGLANYLSTGPWVCVSGPTSGPDFLSLISRMYNISSFMRDLSGWLIDRNIYC